MHNEEGADNVVKHLDGTAFHNGTIDEAAERMKALQKMQTLFDPPDLILTDVVMPQMSGIDLVHQVRQ